MGAGLARTASARQQNNEQNSEKGWGRRATQQFAICDLASRFVPMQAGTSGRRKFFRDHFLPVRCDRSAGRHA